MTTSPQHQPEALDDDSLIREIRRLRDVVQAEFDSLTPDGDRSRYDETIAALDAASQVAAARGLELPPGK